MQIESTTQSLKCRLLVGACLLVLQTCATGPYEMPSVPNPESRRLIQTARQAYARGQFEQAEHSARKALTLNPESAAAYYELARIYDERGATKQAFECVRNALAIKPDFGPALRLLGYLYLNQGRWHDSAAASRRALDALPNDVAGHVNLGYALQRVGEGDRAYFHYQKALAIDDRHREALLYSGGLLLEMRRVSEARHRFERALRYHPESAEAHFQLGAFLVTETLSPPTVGARPPARPTAKTERPLKLATHHLERSVALEPELTAAYRLLAYLALRTGDYKQAISRSQQSLRLAPEDALTRYNLGLAYYYSAEYEAARREFQRVLEAYPETEFACLFHANASLHLGDVEEAFQFYNRTLELNPNNATAHSNLSKIYAARGEQDPASRHLKRACESGLRALCD